MLSPTTVHCNTYHKTRGVDACVATCFVNRDSYSTKTSDTSSSSYLCVEHLQREREREKEIETGAQNGKEGREGEGKGIRDNELATGRSSLGSSLSLVLRQTSENMNGMYTYIYTHTHIQLSQRQPRTKENRKSRDELSPSFNKLLTDIQESVV